MKIFFIFPVHLFSDIKQLKDNNYNEVYLIEEPRYFEDFKYHKLKLVYHRASMKNYYDKLKDEKIKIKYIDFKDVDKKFYNKFKKYEVDCYDMNDFELENKLKKTLKSINIIPTLNFTLNPKIIEENKSKFINKNGQYRHDAFYEWQRKRLDILMLKDGKPKGGQWSFDKDNRKPLPKSVKVDFEPKNIGGKDGEYYNEAKEYIEKNFKNNYGLIDNTIYPITHESAKKWLKEFLEERFKNFGLYEDAETDRNPFLFHSVLTPMMNIGLLTDDEVLKETQKFEDKVPISAYEGFIRQIIGWRNYIYTIYVLEGPKMKKMNFMNNKNKIDEKKWWTNIGVKPIDYIIGKIDKYSYAHHIERLMYLGNFMFLLEIEPDDVYKMFMEWTIDAYEWVMVPNVYGMSQYADGGIMMTRPYFSSSNYILKMSDWKKESKSEDGGMSWCEKWDILYYNFIGRNREMLKKNYATAQQVIHWDRKSETEKERVKKEAKKIMKDLI